MGSGELAAETPDTGYSRLRPQQAGEKALKAWPSRARGDRDLCGVREPQPSALVLPKACFRVTWYNYQILADLAARPLTTRAEECHNMGGTSADLLGHSDSVAGGWRERFEPTPVHRDRAVRASLGRRGEKMLSRPLALWGVCLLAAIVKPAAAQWTATVLQPSGIVISNAYGVSGGQQVGDGAGAATGGAAHALLWTGSAASWVDLHPAGFLVSHALAVSGGQQVGCSMTAAGSIHAGLWTGGAASWIDLHPTGWGASHGYGVSGAQQVGSGNAAGGYTHALLWTGSAASRVDLNPAGLTLSEALGVSAGWQVGYGFGTATGNSEHAGLWTGTAASWVDLNPAGFVTSRATAVSGGQGQQVGYGSITAGGSTHALLWTGTPGSCVDLNPAGFTWSRANSVSGGQQVGCGLGAGVGSYPHALIWTGSAGSWTDLHGFLPAGYRNSEAQAIYTSAGETWVVGYAGTLAGDHNAVMWHYVVPEPSSLFALGCGLLSLAALARQRGHRSRKRRNALEVGCAGSLDFRGRR